VSIDKTDFDSINEQDLVELIDGQVPENLLLEYKLTCYGARDKDKHEFLKDVSALANSQGGHLILGIKESEGLPDSLEGVGADIDIDDEITRMEQILHSGLEPKITGHRIGRIQVNSERDLIVIRVSRSWNSPHRVISKNSNRFYIRHSAGVHEPSTGELRNLFNQSDSALNKARNFREERISFIANRNGIPPLEGGGRLIIHIVPIAAFSGVISINMDDANTNHLNFAPMSDTGSIPRFNVYGFINKSSGDDNLGYTQLFRNGIIEATMARIIDTSKTGDYIPGIFLENKIFLQLDRYVNGLRELGVPPPLVVMITLEGVLDVQYVVNTDTARYRNSAFPISTVILPECLIEQYGQTRDYHKAIRPAFDALWNAAGLSRAGSFSDRGEWVGTS